jgi:purple acid phosphatase-like protein/calcineurin-like phosphoesterase family protein
MTPIAPTQSRRVAFVGTRLVLAVVVAATLTIVATSLTPSGAAAATSSALRRYPYLTDLVLDGVRVNWATTTAMTTGSVTYGRSGVESCTAHTVSATKKPITVGSTAEYQWMATIKGLLPNTSYCYRIRAGSMDLLGTDPSPVFRSQIPAGSAASYSFAVLGDWGSQTTSAVNVDQANLLSRVAASGARFAVTTGDVAYDNGSQTNYGDLTQTGPSVSTVFGPSYWTVAGASIPMFNLVGNHGFNSTALINWPETRAASSSGGRYVMQTYCCTNGTQSKSYPSAWYAFDAGPARFYVLDAAWANSNVGSADLYENDYDNHWTPTSAEYKWLAQDLQAHAGGLKFAFFHFPLHSANNTEVSDTFLSGANHLEGLLAANGVDIVFNGHAHIYARSTPSAGMPVSYVTGGGGAQLEPANRCGAPVAAALGWSYSSSTHGSSCGSLPRPATIDRVFHFLLVTVKGSSVTVAPTDERGRTFDVQTYSFS